MFIRFLRSSRIALFVALMMVMSISLTGCNAAEILKIIGKVATSLGEALGKGDGSGSGSASGSDDDDDDDEDGSGSGSGSASSTVNKKS